jgi:hypothetical protein
MAASIKISHAVRLIEKFSVLDPNRRAGSGFEDVSE